MKLLREILTIARIETQYLVHYPKLLLATLAITLVPTGYVLIYLFSVWDPLAHSAALPVAVVNLDRGVQIHGQIFNVGLEVVSQLQLDAHFGYRMFPDEDEARREVRLGRMAFALIIPREFSANAVPGAEPGAGKPLIFASEGNNYQSASLARHFAEMLATRINQSLNERRWALVLETASGSQHSVTRLRAGIRQLLEGAELLQHGAEQTSAGAQSAATGSQQLDQGVQQFAEGFRLLAEGVKALDAKRPHNADLKRLKNGGETLVSGHAELGKGLDALHAGAAQLRSNAEIFRSELQGSRFAPKSALEGAEQFVQALGQLESGLAATRTGEEKLADGADSLNSGVASLTTGVHTAFQSIHAAAQKLPEDAELDTLENGSAKLASGTHALAAGNQKLAEGARQLAAGIRVMAQALPAELPSPEGSAKGLADSVQPQIEVDSPVPNSGSGLAPNVIPGALWLGAGLAAFLLQARALPRQTRNFSTPAKVLGKLIIPTFIVLAQTACVLLAARYLLQIPLLSPPAFVLCLGIASLSFLFIIFALTVALGDVGKGIAMIMLAVQLSSSGGILPVELSGRLFVDISPWLPLTWVVRAMRATMFGAYDGAWQTPIQIVAGIGLAAFVLACVAARWRYVSPRSMQRAIDL